jgi:HD-GYP domain-containing protein (c-di-GMP phosphodiesterase class II)
VVVLRRANINSLEPGVKLARPIYTENGSTLIGIGVELSQRFIDRLKSLGVDYVYIEDKWTLDIIPEDVLRDETRKKSVDTVFTTMTALMSTPHTKSKLAISNMGSTFSDLFKEILNDLPKRSDVLVNLINLHSKDGYLFHHSVNVAILAGVMGMAKGYNRNQLIELGVGALLFDIGMTVFPDELYIKSTDLTSEQRIRIQRHTEEGFNILRRQFDISLLSAHCALQHHERFDGTGYPRGITGGDIHEYAQIVAIADVYDALTSPRPYRKRYSPGEAIEYLYANGNQWFDIQLIREFCKHIAIYPVSTTVLLNTGQVGVVCHVNPSIAHRPIVRIIQEAAGVECISPYEIDLSIRNNITITQTI